MPALAQAGDDGRWMGQSWKQGLLNPLIKNACVGGPFKQERRLQRAADIERDQAGAWPFVA